MSFNQEIANLMLEKAKETFDLSNINSSGEVEPYLVILGGQPGSGKSSAIEIIEAKYSRNIIVLNGDDFKPSYPNYDDKVVHDSLSTSKEVQPYSNYVVDQLKDDYSNKKFNIVIEGTMRTSEVPLNTIKAFKNKGYKAEAYVVASNYYASRKGCLLRMEKEILYTGLGRAVPIDLHDEAYKNIPQTLQKLFGSQELENITVLARDGTVLAQMRLGDDIFKIYQKKREQLSSKEFIQIDSDLNFVVEMMLNRNAPDNEIQAVNDLQKKMHEHYNSLIDNS